MSPLLMLLVACNPQDLTVTDASYFVWLADNSSASLEDGSVSKKGLTLVDCGPDAEACVEDLDEEDGCLRDDDGDIVLADDGDGHYPGCPEGMGPDDFDPEYFSWLAGDKYYLDQGELDPWRAEALLTNEGDFQITLHHEIGKEDFRFAFVIDPVFEPSVCIQEGQSCYTTDDPANIEDSDGDGWADYHDPDCLYNSWEVGFASNECNNGIDDDGDGVIDADDDGCEHAFDTAEAQVSETCRDNVDNDNDGWIDEDDPDCLTDGESEDGRLNDLYACTDLVDNDGDGLADGSHANKSDGDPGCDNALDNLEDGPTDEDPCKDEFDNDGDGWVDSDDLDCEIHGDEVGISTTRCNDGQDNDGDTLVDALDPGCLIALDANEEDMVEITVTPEDTGLDPYTVFACDDGEDNDADGWIDMDDPDCILGVDEDNSYFGLTECNNGLVDDPGDPAACADPDTSITTDDTCDHVDDDCDGEIDEDWVAADSSDECVYEFDADDADCRTGMDNLESDIASSSCKNTDENGEGIDDDGDGWANEDDPDCQAGLAEVGFSAFTCNDGLDNDGDGGTDAGVSEGYVLVEIPAADTADDSTWVYEFIYSDADSGCGAGNQWTETPSGGMSTCLDNDQVCEEDLDEDDGCARDSDGAIVYVDVGIDNDGDGWANFDDLDCLFGNGEAVNTKTDTECSDGLDNDGDGDVDALDADCYAAGGTHELTSNTCLDGLDNDGDGWLDADDLDCADGDIAYERGFSAGLCSDGQDNDGDGLVDAGDDGCDSSVDPFEEEFNQCTDGDDNDADGWVDSEDPDCTQNSPYEDNGAIFDVYACNNGVDDDNDELIDYYDSDCETAFDNNEATEVAGDPIPFYLDNHPVLDAWSADEDGHTIWYVNAGSYQLSPFNDQDFWTLPAEWRSGFATAKYASEEFLTETQDFFYYGMNFEDPNYAGLEAAAADVQEDGNSWLSEPCDLGLVDPSLTGGEDGACGFEYKVESNAWRPVDIDGAGLDNWVEGHHSFVRLENVNGEKPVIEVGGTVKGDFQLYLGGYESASGMIVKGSFEVNDIRKDRWGYDDLEAEKFEESGREACEY